MVVCVCGGGGVIHSLRGRGKYKYQNVQQRCITCNGNTRCPGENLDISRINEQSNKYVLHYKTRMIK